MTENVSSWAVLKYFLFLRKSTDKAAGMPRTYQRVVVGFFSFEGCVEGGVDEVVQFAPHGGTEELLVSEHCLADCPRRLPVFFCFTVHCLPVSRSVVEAGDKCGAGPPRCKWPFSQPRRLLLSATHSHLVPLLFSSTNHFILAGSLPSVLCWQALFDSNVMQAERFKPVSLLFVFLMNYVKKGCHWFLQFWSFVKQVGSASNLCNGQQLTLHNTDCIIW